jgi:hypothetical protein
MANAVQKESKENMTGTCQQDRYCCRYWNGFVSGVSVGLAGLSLHIPRFLSSRDIMTRIDNVKKTGLSLFVSLFSLKKIIFSTNKISKLTQENKKKERK